MKDGIVYRHYSLPKPLIVNGYEFNKIVISDHYEEKHNYLTDKDILEITQQLSFENYDVYHEGITEHGYKWQNFYHEPFFYKGKPYRLVWYWEIGKTWLLIIHCHRVSEKKYKNYEQK